MEPSLDPTENYWEEQPEKDDDFELPDDPEPNDHEIWEAENRWQAIIDDRW